MTLDEAVWVDPGRMSGVLCFRGTRLPVQQLFERLADGASLDEFVAESRIDRAAAEAVLCMAGTELVARLVRRKPKGKRQASVLKGRVVIPDSFFKPLPEDELRLWEGR